MWGKKRLGTLGGKRRSTLDINQRGREKVPNQQISTFPRY